MQIGGATSNAGNTISGNGGDGIEVYYYDYLGIGTISPVIVGNRIGTDANGANDRGNAGNGIFVGGLASPIIGGQNPGEGNTISGNEAAGIYFSGGASNAPISGNRIGVSSLGAPLGNTGAGVVLNGTYGLQIGKENVSAANIIGANGTHGILIKGSSQNFKIVNNYIGTNALNQNVGNNGSGVFITDEAHDGQIGGATNGSGNQIAFNASGGITVKTNPAFNAPPRGNSFFLNSIHSNGGLGIDLGDDNVTANDWQDADAGANDLQNFPVIQGASPTQINGVLNSTPNTPVRIDFYRVDACDLGNHGEGRYYLGSLDAKTDAGGDAPFLTSNFALVAGQKITATATRKNQYNFFDGTSEFSQCVTVAAQSAGNLSFSSANYFVNEADKTATITVNRNNGASGVVSVQYSSSGGTATVDQDYTPTVGTVTFLDGETSKTFTVNINDDEADEPLETFNLQLSSASGGAAIVNPSVTTVSINDNDNPPVVSASSVAQSEGNQGAKNFAFDITLSQPSGFPVAVNYQTADQTANAGIDYAATNGTINFAPGETAKQINVAVNGDLTIETDETFAVNLSNPTNATIGTNGVGTIKDDDNPGKLQFAPVVYNVNESNGSIVVTVKRTDGSAGTATVNYAAANNGTATAGSDFTAISGTLTFLNGELEKTFTVTILEDQAIESTESINLVLSNPTGGGTLGANNATIYIADNDAPATVSINGNVIYGSTPANQIQKKVYGVTLSATGAPNVSATTDTFGAYALNNLTAGADYSVALGKIGDVNGITAFDATLVLRHVAAGGSGQNALNANQQLAADANNSGTITAFDATQILRFVAAAGQTAATGAVGNWKFAPATRAYKSLDSSMSNEDYTAVLIGEVNGNWTPPTVFESLAESDSETGEAEIAFPDNLTAGKGETIIVPIVWSDPASKTVSAYSFDVKFDPTTLQLDATNPVEATETLSEKFNVVADANAQTGRIGIAASSDGGETVNFNRSGTLLKLRFRVLGASNSLRRATSSLNFAAKPIFEDNFGNPLTAKRTNGYITFARNAEVEFVTISGRVAVGERGIRNAIVTLTAANGETRSVLTGEGGVYSFSNLAANAYYTVSVSSKRFAFNAPMQVLNVVKESREDVNFTAEN